MKENTYVLSIVTRNTLCVLQRVAGMFSRYRVNIENIQVIKHTEELSYWTMVINSTDEKTHQLIKQLSKIIEMIEVKILDKVTY